MHSKKFKLPYLISRLIKVFGGDVLSRMQLRLAEWYRTKTGCNIANLPEFKACVYYKIEIYLFRQVFKTIRPEQVNGKGSLKS